MKFVRSTLASRNELVNLVYPRTYRDKSDVISLTTRVVEVGVYEGDFAMNFINKPKLLYSAVDPWNSPRCEGTMVGGEEHLQKLLDRIHGSSDVTVIRKTSQEAVRLFVDQTQDLVYLDAEHTYDAALSDLYAWWPKVKSGGILAGHDIFTWTHIGVTQAVIDFFTDTQPSLFPVYIVKDEWPSWYVIKD